MGIKGMTEMRKKNKVIGEDLETNQDKADHQ